MKEKHVHISCAARRHRALTLWKKIAFLEARGYAFEDIVAHQVVELPVSRMAATLDELSRYGLEPGDAGEVGGVSLSMLYYFARYRRLNTYEIPSLRPISCVLGVCEGEIKDLLATAPKHARR